MTDIQKKILEIECKAKILIGECDSVDAGVYLYKQRVAVLGMQDGLSFWLRSAIGELKNEFGIGIKQELEKENLSTTNGHE